MNLHPGQRSILLNASRFNVVACGRRFGKTALGVTIAAVGAPGAPGGLMQGMPVGWFAPTYKLLDEVWHTSRAFFREFIARVDGQQHRIELITGGKLDFWTLEDIDAGRSRKYAITIVDEAAASRNLQKTWEESIRPTLTDMRGAGWFLSTPKGLNYFHQLYQRGVVGHEGEWKAHQAPTSANPFIAPAEIDSARRNLPERVFAQEYLATFLADGAGVFRGIESAPSCPWRNDAEAGRGYTIGVDWGRHEDFTVFSVIDDHHQLVHVDRFTGIGYELQTGRLIELWNRFRRCPIIAEVNSMGGPLIEALQRRQVTVRAFHTTNASKGQAIEALALAIENGRLALPLDERVKFLREELLSFESERLPSGLIRYGAPKGQHDDGVMSLAIAWHGASVPHIEGMMRVAGL